MGAVNQSVQNTARGWPPIDIVTHEDMDGPPRWVGGKISVDSCQHLIKQVQAPMHITNGVDADASWKARCGFAGPLGQASSSVFLPHPMAVLSETPRNLA